MNLGGREEWRKGRKRIRIKKRTLWYTCGHKLVEVAWHNVITGERCLAFRALPLIATIKPFPFHRFVSPPVATVFRPSLFSCTPSDTLWLSCRDSTVCNAILRTHTRVRARQAARCTFYRASVLVNSSPEFFVEAITEAYKFKIALFASPPID